MFGFQEETELYAEQDFLVIQGDASCAQLPKRDIQLLGMDVNYGLNISGLRIPGDETATPLEDIVLAVRNALASTTSLYLHVVVFGSFDQVQK